MPDNRPFPLAAGLALTALLAACGDTATAPVDGEAAAAEAPAEIEQRQDNFEEIGDAFKAIRGQMEGDAPDFAAIESQAAAITTAAGRIKGLFPEGTSVEDGYDTEALPTIWQQPEKFAAAADNLVTRSEALATAASAGDAAAVGAAVQALGGACKDCHDTFRLDKD